MTPHTSFADAALALSHATDPDSDFCGPFVDTFDFTGAAVSTLGDALGSETVSATDVETARLSEIEIDLGEGPGWEAVATHRPVLQTDLQHALNPSWPLAWQALHETGLGAVFAFPLVVAGIDVGAIGLYSTAPREMSTGEIRDVTTLSTILARQVMRRVLLTAKQPEEDAGRWDNEYSRREVHQATGMVLAQMHIVPDDALMVIQGHAFATGRPVRDVATDVVARTLDFTPITD